MNNYSLPVHRAIDHNAVLADRCKWIATFGCCQVILSVCDASASVLWQKVEARITHFFAESSLKLFQTDSTDARATFFCKHVLKLWNNLPSNTDFSFLSAFKRSISKILTLLNYLKYCWFFVVFLLFLCSFVPLWLLFNYRKYCRGTIRAFRAWLLLLYSQLWIFSCNAVLKRINLMKLELHCLDFSSCTTNPQLERPRTLKAHMQSPIT